MERTNSLNNRPVILDNICSRKTDNSNPQFYYDRNLDLNVVKTSSGIIPFISSSFRGITTYTETKILREADDAELNCCELMTKTENARERDDEILDCNELLTKTSAHRESDDDTLWSAEELTSKTFADRERDDEDGPAYYQ